MYTIAQLKQKLEDSKERSDLPIEDFVDWDGFIRLIESHIEANEQVEAKEKENNVYAASERMSMNVNPYGY